MTTPERPIEAIDALIAELTEGEFDNDDSRRRAAGLREQWAVIKACWADPDIRRMVCAEHLLYQAAVKAGRVQ
ncbi:MAG TPA: hypothetical protein VK638_47680 [Edaphobacter sp.]|nr:hypothetical protein [Edaphobacter sp.]